MRTKPSFSIASICTTIHRNLVSFGTNQGPKKRFDPWQDEDNGAWLEEVAVRMLCLLSLDRFGDFVSDQVP